MDAFRWCLWCLFLYPYYRAPFWRNDNCRLHQKDTFEPICLIVCTPTSVMKQLISACHWLTSFAEMREEMSSGKQLGLDK